MSQIVVENEIKEEFIVELSDKSEIGPEEDSETTESVEKAEPAEDKEEEPESSSIAEEDISLSNSKLALSKVDFIRVGNFLSPFINN